MLRRRALLHSLRAIVARSGVLVVAAVLLLGVLRSGARYVYCPMMNAVVAASCCDRGEAHYEGTPAVEGSDCCQQRRTAAMPASGTAPAEIDFGDVPSTPIATPAWLERAGPRAAGALRFNHPARAGPISARKRRAQLMIWTC
ncbi:MAG: hypothetical protein U0270_27060 [Labilithrix sp.]